MKHAKHMRFIALHHCIQERTTTLHRIIFRIFILVLVSFSCETWGPRWGILCDKNCTKTERIKRWRHKGIFFAHAPQPLTCYFHFLFTCRILAYGPFFLPLTSKCHLRRWVLWWNRLNRCMLYAKWHYFLLFFHKSQFDHSFCVS